MALRGSVDSPQRAPPGDSHVLRLGWHAPRIAAPTGQLFKAGEHAVARSGGGVLRSSSLGPTASPVAKNAAVS
ncbi:MAG: hypothetical protein J0I18_23395 [Actinobacteria bacterium]|nr:hypothetical protein [Actinomycetota bacterium]